MDIVSIGNDIPLLIDGYSTRLSKEKQEKRRKLEQKAKQEKVLIVLKSENKDESQSEEKSYIQYTLGLKNEVSPANIRYVHRLIDQMDAWSKMSGVNVLRKGKTIGDLKNAFNEMLYSNTICFDKLRELYNTNCINGEVVEEPVKAFLKLFDIKEEKQCKIEVFEEKMQKSSRKNKKSWVRLRASIKSAPYNTILLNNIEERRNKKRRATPVKKKTR